MKAFTATPPALSLTDLYPDSSTLRSALQNMSGPEREAFLRLWVTEGIPAAFKRAPIHYENLREWLGGRLDVHPKSITVIGSGRIGYSLAPPPEFGREFVPLESDLDLSLISLECFRKHEECFQKWKSDFEAKRVTPKNLTEGSYWNENLVVVPKNLRRGFIDYNKIPFRKDYEFVQHIAQALYVLKQRLDLTPEVPSFRKITLRTYSTWEAFLTQGMTNLAWVLQDRA